MTDVSSAAPSEVEMTNADGSTQTISRVPLRDVYETFDEPAPSGRLVYDGPSEEGVCRSCGEVWDSNTLHRAYRHWLATNHDVLVRKLTAITFQNHPSEES